LVDKQIQDGSGNVKAETKVMYDSGFVAIQGFRITTKGITEPTTIFEITLA